MQSSCESDLNTNITNSCKNDSYKPFNGTVLDHMYYINCSNMRAFYVRYTVSSKENFQVNDKKNKWENN